MFEGASAETIEALTAAVAQLIGWVPYGGTALLVFIFARWIGLPMWQAYCGRSR